ncbi:protein kinase, AMP-activated, beta 2 non-catalytic subunit, isoform CRA_b [Rattus norvegicus]|uniref:Protein kinase, AMP-activated, beta 2 non-catalytic subunit, isoform CRA_b n=1 Tax=Rattus norvegicus TaxID=10116 RepID=A6K3B8_RAT|nr:protein kinase, AMP-activated, beta 2 non-catalytic subunit, isoform CRA_b [Rattus norvegicus]
MGNTTSERVSGERHGAKAARAEGGGHGPGKEHKIMVGSTDDPSVFSLPDSKLPGDKEFVPWQQDLDDSVKPTQQARPTVIRWSEGGKEVFISGSFNNWSTKIPLIKSHNDFVAILDLPEGEHQYKFFVDGQWVHDPSETCPAHPQGLMVKKCMCFDLRRDSNPHPSCPLTSSKLFLTRTLIFHVTQPYFLSPIMLC